MSHHPPIDPAELEDFPFVTVTPEHVFFRVHHFKFEPGYFSTRGDGRFDPPRHSRNEYGTCYVATSETGAFLETLGRIRPLPDYIVRDRVLSEVSPEGDMRVADLTNPAVLGRFGIYGDISAGGDYEVPQQWGNALRLAGLAGVLYRARHDPSFEETSLAFFGPPGEQPGKILIPTKDDPEPIHEGLLRHMQDRFHIFVVPTGTLD